jgi:hypothetical protein
MTRPPPSAAPRPCATATVTSLSRDSAVVPPAGPPPASPSSKAALSIGCPCPGRRTRVAPTNGRCAFCYGAHGGPYGVQGRPTRSDLEGVARPFPCPERTPVPRSRLAVRKGRTAGHRAKPSSAQPHRLRTGSPSREAAPALPRHRQGFGGPWVPSRIKPGPQFRPGPRFRPGRRIRPGQKIGPGPGSGPGLGTLAGLDYGSGPGPG